MTNLNGKNPPRITVVSGFLGSGKTTLIKEMFHQGYLGAAPVLLENDYGSLGIDGELIKSMGLRVSELLSGCICCSLKTEFPYELVKLIEDTKCDNLVIEPSGVGKLSDILNAIAMAEVSWEPGLSICLVDVRLFDGYQKSFPFVYWDQILGSDVVIFNFTQDVESTELNQVMDAIYERDPEKIIIFNDGMVDVVSLLSGVPCVAQRRALDAWMMKKNKSEEMHHDHAHRHAPSFFSFAKSMSGVWSADEIERIMSSLSDDEHYGTVLRAKILVRGEDGILSANYIPGRSSVEKLEENEAMHFGTDFEGRAMVVGSSLNKDALDHLFSK